MRTVFAFAAGYAVSRAAFGGPSHGVWLDLLVVPMAVALTLSTDALQRWRREAEK